jgi:hypothetical protein
MYEVKKGTIKGEKEGKEGGGNNRRKEIKENICEYSAGRKRPKLLASQLL